MRTPALRPVSAPARERGFTLLEVMIAAVMLFLIVGIAARFLASGQSLLSTSALQSEAEVAATRIAQQIAERLRNGALSTVTDINGNLLADGASSTNGITMAQVTGFSGETRLRGSIGIRLGLDGEANVVDGRDNDRDNITDERSIEIVEWTALPVANTRLSLWVPALAAKPLVPVPPVVRGNIGNRVRGLTVTRSGRRLEIRVTVMRYDPNFPDASPAAKVRTFTGTAYLTLRN